MKILIVEDDIHIMETITEYFELAGHTVDCAYNGISAIELLKEESFDILIMDIMMPKLDGMSTTKILRQELRLQTPILFLTARDNLSNKLEAFELGADDYLVKPFSLDELNARMHAIHKRGIINDLALLEVGELTFNIETHEVCYAEKKLSLSQMQKEILKLLMQKHPSVVSRDLLCSHLWRTDPPDSDALRSHIYALRKSLEEQVNVKLLTTIRNEGFCLGRR